MRDAVGSFEWKVKSIIHGILVLEDYTCCTLEEETFKRSFEKEMTTEGEEKKRRKTGGK